jgi:hypothetical protein
MAAAPSAPQKVRPTISRVQHLLNRGRMENAEALRKSSRNVAEMFEPNEHVEVFDFSPVESHLARTNVERSAANRRAGMVTPPRQIQNTGTLALPRKVPGAPIRKRKTLRRRRNGRTRKN